MPKVAMANRSLENNNLRKVLGKWDSVAIIVAIVIGVGIFRTPAEVARYLSSPWLIILAWITGGIISLAGALCYAELSSTFPETGGNYIYLKKSYGNLAAFLFGWSELLVIRTGSIAAMAFIFAEYLVSFLSVGEVFIKGFAVLAVVALGVVNIAGLEYTKKTQNAFVALKLITLVALIVFGFASRKGNLSHFQFSPLSLQPGGISFFCLALIPILWTFGGWHENVFVAGETKNASSTVPFALVAGILIISVLYVAANSLYIYFFTVPEIQNSELIAARVLHALYGQYGRKIFEAIVIISSIASINAMIMTGSRIIYSIARDNALFRYMNKIDPASGMPHRAIILTSLWSILLIMWGSFSKLLFFTGFLVWVFFAVVVAGLFILRHKYPLAQRPYKVWGYPFTPLFFGIISAALAVVTFKTYTTASLIGLALLASGLPVYLASRKIK